MVFEELIINRSFILFILLLITFVYIYYLSSPYPNKYESNHPTNNDLTIEQIEEKLQCGEITIKEYVTLIESISRQHLRK